MLRLTSPLPLLYTMVLLLIQSCLPSPVPYTPRHVQHVDLPLPPLSPDIGAGLGLQVNNTHPDWEVRYNWRGDGSDFPNPFKNTDSCNSGAKYHGKNHSFTCDPDKNMEERQVTMLSDQIEEILSQTACHCQCVDSPCRTSHPMGTFSIGIAVASNVTGSTNNVVRVWAFSKGLREYYWMNMKRCNDALVIVLEVNSQTLYMSPDPIVGKKIPDDCVHVILENTKQYFVTGDYYTGLSEILQYVSNALRGGKCGEKSGGKCGEKSGGLSTGQIVGIVFGVIIGVAMIVGLIVCCVGFFQSWECVITTCIGLVVGTVLWMFQACINALVYACVSVVCEAVGCEPCCECAPLDCVSEDDGVGAGVEY